MPTRGPIAPPQAQRPLRHMSGALMHLSPGVTKLILWFQPGRSPTHQTPPFHSTGAMSPPLGAVASAGLLASCAAAGVATAASLGTTGGT